MPVDRGDGSVDEEAAAQLTAYLADLPAARLVDLLMSQAEEDIERRTQLLLEAASAGGGPLDVVALLACVLRCIEVGERERRDWEAYQPRAIAVLEERGARNAARGGEPSGPDQPVCGGSHAGMRGHTRPDGPTTR